MLIRSCLSCDFHETKKEQENLASYCGKENCWSQFSKCVAKEALRRFIEEETAAKGLLPGPESPKRSGFPAFDKTETP
jgi:hypothetical protein